jgi:hypothetical protein
MLCAVVHPHNTTARGRRASESTHPLTDHQLTPTAVTLLVAGRAVSFAAPAAAVTFVA